MRLSLKAVSMTAGLMWAGCMFLVGILHWVDPHYGTGFLALMSSIYPGLHFTHEWENVIGGTVYGFVDGAIIGLLFAWIYDYLSGGTHTGSHPA